MMKKRETDSEIVNQTWGHSPSRDYACNLAFQFSYCKVALRNCDQSLP